MKLQEGTEEFNKIKELWLKQANDVTIETLPDFLKELTSHQHDYGSICHTMAIAAVATCWAVNHEPCGGITGFQAGAVMWEFIRHWNRTGNKTGMRLIDYDDFLYPQYDHKFAKTIHKDTWRALQEEAGKKLVKADADYARYLKDLDQYEVDIAAFIAKYPDYYENQKYYDHIGMGTGDEHAAYAKKKAEGFEFAPREPYSPVGKHHAVYEHWQSIVAGRVPFGYCLED